MFCACGKGPFNQQSLSRHVPRCPLKRSVPVLSVDSYPERTSGASEEDRAQKLGRVEAEGVHTGHSEDVGGDDPDLSIPVEETKESTVAAGFAHFAAIWCACRFR
jgi:hypothetical protein